MTTLSLRLPDSYHTMVKEITTKDNISINQFIISAVAEKISALETQNYLEERAERGSLGKKNEKIYFINDADNILFN